MNALKLESGKTRFWYRRLLQVQNKTTGQIYLQYYGGGAIDLDADRFKNKLEAFGLGVLNKLEVKSQT